MTQAEQDLRHFLRIADEIDWLHGSAFRMFAESVSSRGKPVGEITLAELADLYKKAVRREKEEREALREKH